MPISHDQNFKNLILDYSRQALEFFAAAEAQHLDAGVSITPIRQEQLKNRLGDRFHELDVPLLVEWPDGRRDALLFVLEEETDPEKQLKYIDFIDIYTAMDDNQMHEYQTRYPQENHKMATLTERLLNEGMQKGVMQGMEQGMELSQNVLQRLLTRRFGPLDSQTRQRLQQATAQELECWADNILDAKTIDEVFVCH